MAQHNPNDTYDDFISAVQVNEDFSAETRNLAFGILEETKEPAPFKYEQEVKHEDADDKDLHDMGDLD